MTELPEEGVELPLGVKGVRVVVLKKREGCLTIRVEGEAPFGVCPGCGVLSEKENGRRVQVVNDYPVSGNAVVLEVVKRRFRCENDFCSRVTFTEEIEGLPRRGRCTSVFLRHIYELSKEMTYSGVSRHLLKAYGMRVSVASIHRCAQEHQCQEVELPDEGEVEAEYIGVDEFSKGKGHD